MFLGSNLDIGQSLYSQTPTSLLRLLLNSQIVEWLNSFLGFWIWDMGFSFDMGLRTLDK